MIIWLIDVEAVLRDKLLFESHDPLGTARKRLQEIEEQIRDLNQPQTVIICLMKDGISKRKVAESTKIFIWTKPVGLRQCDQIHWLYLNHFKIRINTLVCIWIFPTISGI